MDREQIIRKIYGEPGDESNLVLLTLPYKMKLSWDIKTSVSRIRCNKNVRANLDMIFNDLLKIYGLSRIQELGIDIFGGCYEHRPIRGGTRLSKHSWGIAIDLDPINNQLKWDKTKASFAKPEYQDMITTFYKYGFLSLGIEKNFDWMHFEVQIPSLAALDFNKDGRKI
jgi:hypothetical protein